MKKIPTLFKRTYDGNRIKGITDEVMPGLEWVLAGEELATVKIDGTCCAVIGGMFYKRYDAKRHEQPTFVQGEFWKKNRVFCFRFRQLRIF